MKNKMKSLILATVFSVNLLLPFSQPVRPLAEIVDSPVVSEVKNTSSTIPSLPVSNGLETSSVPISNSPSITKEVTTQPQDTKNITITTPETPSPDTVPGLSPAPSDKSSDVTTIPDTTNTPLVDTTTKTTNTNATDTSTNNTTVPSATAPVVSEPVNNGNTIPNSTTAPETTPITKPIDTTPVTKPVVKPAPLKSAPALMAPAAPLAVTPIILTKSGDNVPLYTTDQQFGYIALSGEGQSDPLIGAYLEITIPNTYINIFSVPPASIISKVDPVRNNGDGTSTIRVYLNEVNSTTSASFPFSLYFLDRVTPEGYSMVPSIKLYSSTGDFIQEATGNLTISTKNTKPNLYKYIISNTNEGNKDNNIQVYGGTLNTAGTHIGPTGTNITFQYKLQTEVDRDPMSYGTGLRQTRVPETIVLSDTLPTYTNSSGQLVRAYFDPQLNIGWTLDPATGIVTYTVNSSNPDFYNGGAAKDLLNPKLTLSFPGAPVNTLLTNNVSAKITPYGMQSYETPQVATDDIKFILIGTLMGNGAFGKSNNDASSLILDPGANDRVTSKFIVNFVNKSLYPVQDIVLTDGPFDSRYYVQTVNIYTDPNNIQAVYGVKPDGTKVSLSFSLASSNPVMTTVTPFDKATYDAVKAMAAKVDQGLMTEAEATAVTPVYTGVEVVMKNTFQLQPAQPLSMWVIMGLNDPYHTTPYEPATNPLNTFANYASVKSNILLPSGSLAPFNSTANSWERMRLKSETLTMTKTTDPYTGVLGSNVSFRVTPNFAGLSMTRKFTNPKVIDLLPPGLTYVSTYHTVGTNLIKTEVVENYLGSGRTAVIFYMKDFRLLDVNYTSYYFQISGRINSLAVPSSLVTADNNNINFAYFTADEYKTFPTNVTVANTLPDLYDLDGDGVYGEPIIGNQAFFVPVLPTEIKSVKYIRKTGGAWVTSGIQTLYDTNFEYKLSTSNFDKTQINLFTLYDRLPVYSNGSRNILTGPVTGPTGFTVWYLTGSAPTDAVSGVNATGWTTTPADYSQVTALKVTMDDGRSIAPGETIDFIVPVKTPVYTNGAIDGEKITNVFSTSRDGNVTFGTTNAVFNQLPLNIPVQKNWVGLPLDSVKVELYRTSAPAVTIATLTLNSANSYKGIFSSLPPIDNSGVKITDYAVREVTSGVPNFDYDITISGNQTGGYLITNTQKLIDLSGVKTWNDANNQDGLRPTSIIVSLSDGAKVVATATVDGSNGWKYTFTGLPKYRNGVEIPYTITESEVTGYTTVVNGLNITNTHVPATTSVSGIKTWLDADNQDGVRPSSITINLYSNASTTIIDSRIVTAADNWAYSFNDLPKYSNGNLLTYSVAEADIKDY